MRNSEERIIEMTRPTLQDNEYSPGVPVSGGVISTGELESLSDDEEWTSTWASWSLKTLELMLKIELKFYLKPVSNWMVKKELSRYGIRHQFLGFSTI